MHVTIKDRSAAGAEFAGRVLLRLPKSIVAIHIVRHPSLAVEVEVAVLLAILVALKHLVESAM
jgi:hypothetical protein